MKKQITSVSASHKTIKQWNAIAKRFKSATGKRANKTKVFEIAIDQLYKASKTNLPQSLYK